MGTMICFILLLYSIYTFQYLCDPGNDSMAPYDYAPLNCTPDRRAPARAHRKSERVTETATKDMKPRGSVPYVYTCTCGKRDPFPDLMSSSSSSSPRVCCVSSKSSQFMPSVHDDDDDDCDQLKDGVTHLDGNKTPAQHCDTRCAMCIQISKLLCSYLW